MYSDWVGHEHERQKLEQAANDVEQSFTKFKQEIGDVDPKQLAEKYSEFGRKLDYLNDLQDMYINQGFHQHLIKNTAKLNLT